MKYERPIYNENAEFFDSKMVFGNGMIRVPKIERPISIKENFKRAANHQNPVWVPEFMTDIKRVLTIDLGGNAKQELGEGDTPAARGVTERTDFTDDFGCVWTFVPEAGGPMLKPNHPPVLSDITRWDKDLKWPDLSQNDFIGAQQKFLKENEGDDRVLFLNLGSSCTEKLVAILGGYEQGMSAMAEEPEAVKDFFTAYAEYSRDLYLKMTQLVKVDFVNFHDDYGTERDTFFSCKMLEDLVFEPSKLIIDTIKASGASFQLHSCGKIERFMPYMIDWGINFLQIQERANDIPKLKEVYGDRIGFNIFLGCTPDNYKSVIHDNIDLYGKGGGMYTTTFAGDPRLIWDVAHEIFFYSREYYEGNC